MPDLQFYHQLAPDTFRSYRELRYDGGGFELTPDAFAQEDLASLEVIYKRLKQVYDIWLYMQGSPNWELLFRQLATLDDDAFLGQISTLGQTTYASHQPSSLVRKALHDLRGGALTSLVGYASLLRDFGLESIGTDLKRLVYLARDHAKMMRNLLPFMDPLFREADESNRLHLVEGFVEKWNDFRFHIEDRHIEVVVENHVDGYLTSRCLETSAIDRIVYNYVNNAARFCASKELKLTILFANPNLVRWVVENELDSGQQAWLQEHVGESMAPLFTGGLTQGGHGIGLSSCADLVAASFGVSADTAVQQQYLGATVHDATYYAWFHWPACPASEDDPVCDC